MEKRKQNKFYQITTEERVAHIDIYGYITQGECYSDEVSANDIKKEIDELDVDTINVYINSYGGEVSEAIAIYSVLKRHKATVVTYTDGFACSAATIIFCAGDERVMGYLALLMIHNCMSYIGYANSEELRKAAIDNDKINQSSIEAYKLVSNLSEDEIKRLMNEETWLTAQESLDYGFATEIAAVEENTGQTVQSVQSCIRDRLISGNTQKPNEQIMSAISNLQSQVETLTEMINTDKDKERQPPKEQVNPMLNFFKSIT